MDSLHPQMEEMFLAKGVRIQFRWSVQVKYTTPLLKTVDNDEVENWFRCHDDDDDDDDDERPVYLHSGKLQIQNRDRVSDRIAEARQVLFESNSVSISGKSNLGFESIGDVCFKVVKNAKKIQ